MRCPSEGVCCPFQQCATPHLGGKCSHSSRSVPHGTVLSPSRRSPIPSNPTALIAARSRRGTRRRRSIISAPPGYGTPAIPKNPASVVRFNNWAPATKQQFVVARQTTERFGGLGLIGWKWAGAAQDHGAAPGKMPASSAPPPLFVGLQPSVELHEFKELFQPSFLVTSQPLRFGEHTFDHFPRLVPIAKNTCLHEDFTRSRVRTVGRDDVSDDGSKLIYDLHGSTLIRY